MVTDKVQMNKRVIIKILMVCSHMYIHCVHIHGQKLLLWSRWHKSADMAISAEE